MKRLRFRDKMDFASQNASQNLSKLFIFPLSLSFQLNFNLVCVFPQNYMLYVNMKLETNEDFGTVLSL